MVVESTVKIDWIIQQDITEGWNIESENDGHVATVETEEEANLIVKAVYEYVGVLNGQSTGRNVGIPRVNTLLRAIEDSIRRSRQTFADRSLDGVCIHGQYTPCQLHKDGECPTLQEQIQKRTYCFHELTSLEMILIDNRKFRLRLEAIE